MYVMLSLPYCQKIVAGQKYEKGVQIMHRDFHFKQRSNEHQPQGLTLKISPGEKISGCHFLYNVQADSLQFSFDRGIIPEMVDFRNLSSAVTTTPWPAFTVKLAGEQEHNDKISFLFSGIEESLDFDILLLKKCLWLVKNMLVCFTFPFPFLLLYMYMYIYLTLFV
jgi:hypothetical protein